MATRSRRIATMSGLIRASSSLRIMVTDLPAYIREGMRTGQPVASPDVQHDPRFDHPAIRTMPVEARSILSTPVFSKGTVRGAVLSYRWSARHDFTDDELK